MRTIWKFPLKIQDEQVLNLQKGAAFLQPSTIHDQLFIWAIVDTEAETKKVVIEIFGTGNPIPAHERDYLGTALQFGGSLVWHVFVRTPGKTDSGFVRDEEER